VTYWPKELYLTLLGQARLPYSMAFAGAWQGKAKKCFHEEP